MFHNTLYRLERNQRICLTILAGLFLLATIVWLAFELFDVGFPMEPVVVLLGGFATLFAVFWPFTATYSSKRRRGRIRFDYSTHDNKFKIGHGDLTFTLQFSRGGDTMIHMYGYPPDIAAIALSGDAGKIADVRDVTTFHFVERSVEVPEGQIVALRNVQGHYALVHVHDVRDATRDGDDFDEVTFSYAINPDKGTDFR